MNALNLVYFSPTGTTKTVVKAIAKEIDSDSVHEFNLSPNRDCRSGCKIDKSSLTIIGVPVYAGRLPLPVIEKLEAFKADNAPVVLVVVYGNRAFDDALLELHDIAEKLGFKTIAAAAYIGEHSFSTDSKPIAQARPDAQDLLKCAEFGQEIGLKMEKFLTGDIEKPEIPGSYPYKVRSQRPALSPETDEDGCDKCGVCAEVCPTNAIAINGKVETDTKLCIWCCACVRHCPQNVRVFENPTINGIVKKLSEMCKDRKEPEFFL